MQIDWTATFTALTAASTGALAFVAWQQLREIKRAQRNWATLQACDRYDLDPIISATVKELKRYEFADDATRIDLRQSTKDNATRLLNFLDAIAIGIEQGFYNREIVRDHLFRIMQDWVDLFKVWPIDYSADEIRRHFPALCKYLDDVNSENEKPKGRN